MHCAVQVGHDLCFDVIWRYVLIFIESPRAAIALQPSGEPPPLTVMTSSGQVPIKLEISLNSKQSDLVARAVQTGGLRPKL